jgi:hypothetical protein
VPRWQEKRLNTLKRFSYYLFLNCDPKSERVLGNWYSFILVSNFPGPFHGVVVAQSCAAGKMNRGIRLFLAPNPNRNPNLNPQK